MSIVTLAAKPPIAEEIRRDAVRLLEAALQDVKDGRFDGVMLVLREPGGAWCDERTAIIDTASAIGYLEIIKQRWIRDYLDRTCNCN